MIENDDYKISPYFWKRLSGCSRFCHTAAFTVTRAQARMCSATLASTNEGGPCASHDCTVCTFCRSKYMLKLAQTTFNMKTEHIKWVLHARTHTRTHTHTHTPALYLWWNWESQKWQLPDLAGWDIFPSFHHQKSRPCERAASGGDCLDQTDWQTPLCWSEAVISTGNIEKILYISQIYIYCKEITKVNRL